MTTLNLFITSGNKEYERVLRIHKDVYDEEYFRIELKGLTWYANTGMRKRSEQADDGVGFDAFISGNNLLVMVIYADNRSEVVFGNDFVQYRWTVKPWANIYKGFDVNECSDVGGITTYKDVKCIMVAPNNGNGRRYLNIKYPEDQHVDA